MQVSISLYGTDQNGQLAKEPRFHLVSLGGDQSFKEQKAAFDHFRSNTSVQGLGFEMNLGGNIILTAHEDQLHPEMVVTIRRHATEALESLGAPVEG